MTSRKIGLASFACLLFGLPIVSSSQTSVSTKITRLPSMLYLPRAADTLETAAMKEPQLQIKSLDALKTSTAPSGMSASSVAGAEAATRGFLLQNAKELGLDNNVADFRVRSTRETPNGRHIDVEQRYNGLRVIGGQIQLKTARDGSIQTVSRNIVLVPPAMANTVKKNGALSDAKAQAIAWNDLNATGELLEPPTVERAYLNENNVLTLVQVVQIAVDQPFGYWEYTIDSVTGRIVAKRDRRIREDKKGIPGDVLASGSGPAVATASFDAAVARFSRNAKRRNDEKAADKAPTFGSATALVFFPNPVSTLADMTLKDSDAPGRFDAAYVSVTLDDVRKANGKVSLDGRLVRIEDFERGDGGLSQPPSTAMGGWTARRGSNAFNDVMTYFHIHRNLMYLRGLGYADGADLFPTGIAVDTDGVLGDDNSHYVPGSDRLAFGHGCVDDNEDTDVILHELGHAITHHLNERWGGGDAGAIGEGFGDYWAVSHRIRMTNGSALDAGKVFVWDGIAECWSGRRVDRTNAAYEPNRRYGAHEPMNGFVSDELWSTPLVLALRELIAKGEPHESVDKVVLAGMDGIGSNFTMRSLALNTVLQARQMFPGKPHGDVFEKHFQAMRILP